MKWSFPDLDSCRGLSIIKVEFSPMARKYNVSDGKLLLTLELMKEGGFLVRTPSDPAVITEADSIPEAFTMARDAMKCLQASRVKRDRSVQPRRRASA